MTLGNSTGKTIKDGMKVRAIGRITEGGCGHEGDPNIPLADEQGRVNPEYVHAEPSELGIVDDVIDDDVFYVHLDRSGTGSIVSAEEVEPVEPTPASQADVIAPVESRNVVAAAPPAVS